MIKQTQLERTQWPGALMALPGNELLSFTRALSEGWTLRPKSLPQSGLGMLKIKESALGEPFYLGEFPVASAWLDVTTPDGQSAEGAAHVMDDRVELAEALALCDAVLSGHLPGWQDVLDMLEKGQALRQIINNERKLILARTQVDFSLLDDAGDNDAEA